MTNIELILILYSIVGVISAFYTGMWSLTYDMEGIDNFWDWVIYNVFWIVQPIKAIIKFFRNII